MKKKRTQYRHKDCFALKPSGTCNCLNETNCWGCGFYKPKLQAITESIARGDAENESLMRMTYGYGWREFYNREVMRK